MYCFILAYKIKMALNKNQIVDSSNHYSRAVDTCEQNSLFQEYLEKYRNDHFRIFKLICHHKSGIKFIEKKNKKLIYLSYSTEKKHVLLAELNKSCYIKVINRRKKSRTFKFNL